MWERDREREREREGKKMIAEESASEKWRERKGVCVCEHVGCMSHLVPIDT